MGVSVGVAAGVSVGDGVSVGVGEGVSVGVRVKVGVLVGVSEGGRVGVNVTAGRSIGPPVPSPSSSRKIQPPSYCWSVGFNWAGAICNHVPSSLRALKSRHVPTRSGTPMGG